MKPYSFDVVIIGGGPGGSATALSLLAHAPTLSIAIIEASQYEDARMGESLPPVAGAIFEHLKLSDAFTELGPRESFGTSATWGQSMPLDNEFIFWPARTGWQLNRASFDEMLAHEAANRGAILMLATSVRNCEITDEQCVLHLSGGATVSSKFVVDATGSSATFARNVGARFLEFDRLIGISRFFECSETDSRVTVESFKDGWWYTAGLPDGKRVTCCVTDADLAQQLKLNKISHWQERLETTRTIAELTNVNHPCGNLTVRSTNSRLLEPVCGENWLAVGDAASRFDPLSSQGITKALRSGIFASYAIGDWLIRRDESGLQRYQRYVRKEFESYTQTRAGYYRQEQRWPNSEFWRRRHVD